MTALDRLSLLRAWAAWDESAREEHGTDEGVRCRVTANRLAEVLGDFTDDDLRVIDAARSEYRKEASV